MTDTPSTDSIDRRTALAAMGGVVMAGIASAHTGSTTTSAAFGPGYDATTGEYSLPELPYAYDALEPHLDAQTMEIHHSKHHAGYVRGLNRALTKLREIREGGGDVGLIKHWSRELAFNGSGHVNHTLFFLGMKPPSQGGGGFPKGELASRIDRDFGGFAMFAAHFKAAAGAVEGSGWGWLCWEPVGGKLIVLQGEKQQNLNLTGVVPLLGVDVWEHAYYLNYQNRRGEYLDAFMRVIDWDTIGQRFAAATSA
ncbi:MAG: superoxide dismutase [Planctomycetota bacterium]